MIPESAGLSPKNSTSIAGARIDVGRTRAPDALSYYSRKLTKTDRPFTLRGSSRLGSHDGEFCKFDRAMIFEDPDGIRIEINFVPGRGLLKD